MSATGSFCGSLTMTCSSARSCYRFDQILFWIIIYCFVYVVSFFFSSRRRHTRSTRDWSSDVCSSDLRIAGSGEALLASPLAALIRRTSEAGITCNCLAVSQMAGQDLVDQHIRRFDADADDPRNEAYH